MRVAVVGAGGVGGYFGGLLAQAGHEVDFVARGSHLEALRARGLQVHSVNGDFHVYPVLASDDPAQIGVVDYVILAVKHYDLPAAAVGLRPLVGPQTAVVPLLNGVDAHEVLIAALGPRPVVAGTCSLVSMIEAPGIIRQDSKLRRVAVGELDGQPSERLGRLVRAWAEAGADASQPDDIIAALWAKFVFIASFGGVTALTRANAGEARACPETRVILLEAMREVEGLAWKRGVRLPQGTAETSLATVDGFEAEATSSMQRDVVAGRAFELEAFSGAVVRMAAQVDFAVPVHRIIDALLRPALKRALASRRA